MIFILLINSLIFILIFCLFDKSLNIVILFSFLEVIWSSLITLVVISSFLNPSIVYIYISTMLICLSTVEVVLSLSIVFLIFF